MGMNFNASNSLDGTKLEESLLEEEMLKALSDLNQDKASDKALKLTIS